MNDESRTCHWCGRTVTGICADCQTELANRCDPRTMTVRQRIIEFDWFFHGDGQYCEVPHGEIQQRIEALMGRSVWTHEMGTKGMEALRWELEQQA